MAAKPPKRKLTTILFADVVGYSRLTGADEIGTHRAVMETLDLANTAIVTAGGRVLRYAGDAILAEFDSVVSCVDTAVGLQTALAQRNRDIPTDQQVQIRVGINLGEVIEDRGEIYGDGVNVAARLEALAPPGSVCISGQVAEQVAGKLQNRFVDAGRHRLKNIERDVAVWCWPEASARQLARGKRLLNGKRVAAVAGLVALLIAGWVYTLLPKSEIELASGPRLAVIPFKNLSSDAEDAYFSEGLTQDISTQLSRFSNLFLIASSSLAEYRNGSDCVTIRDDLQAAYILEGSVRRSEDSLRVTTSLIDAGSCQRIESPGPFDRDLNVANLLDIQLEIATKVVAQIGSADAPLFNAKVQSAIRDKAPDSLAAYECVLLSYWFYENFEPERLRRARSCLENSLQTDPDYSLGWSRLASVYLETRKYDIDTPPNWEALSLAAATRALELDPDNANAYYVLAIRTQMTSQDTAEFTQFADRAVSLNPNDAFVLADLGTWMGYSGLWERGKEWVARAMQLNPRHQSWLYQIWHLDYYRQQQYQESRDAALKMNLPGNFMVQASLAAAYAMNGEQQKAEETLSRVLELRPDFAADPRAPFRARGLPPELIEQLMLGLRAAGLEVEIRG